MIKSLYPRLPETVRALLEGVAHNEISALEEIRAYRGRPLELMIADKNVQTGLMMDDAEMSALLLSLSGHALYRFERQMAEGYIPLEGGHRAGVCGWMTRVEDGTWRMSGVSSVCIRIARKIEGASLPVQRHLFAQNDRPRRVLLLGAPGCGKTTVLRDAALYMAKHIRVAVADEREELFAQEDRKASMDVLSGVPKAHAFPMLIRSMAPQMIVCDELGRKEDVEAMLDAARCGVGVLASAHADGFKDFAKRPAMRRLFDEGVFERYIHLGWHGSILAVWDESGRSVEKEVKAGHGQLGDGCDGDDRHQQRRVLFVGRGEEARALDSGDAAVPAALIRRYSL